MNAVAQFPFQPQADNAGAARGFMLAVVVHGLLFMFLYFGISWQSRTPEAPVADLWQALPAMNAAPAPQAAPPVPTPPTPKIEEPQPVEPPPPAPPDIRIKEQEKKPLPPKKADPPKKIEPPKVEPKAEPPKKAEVKPLPPKPLPPKDSMASQAERELNNIGKSSVVADAGKELENLRSGAAGRAARTWGEKVAALVRSKVPVSVADTVPGNPTATFEVTLLPGREVGVVKLVKSSGYPAYDEAAERAIKAISPLPPFTDGMTPQRNLRLETRPKDQ